MLSIVEKERKVNIVDEYDVIVVGGRGCRYLGGSCSCS